MAKTLGIFGGTFDPPHIGHQILAAEAQYQLGLDTVLWVLTPDPPHKKQQTITPVEQRLQMVQAAVADAPGFEVSRVEIDRSPPHYAIDTVKTLQKQNPQSHLIYLMGADSLHDLPTWYAAPVFLAACHGLGVMRRPGTQIDLGFLETQLPGITAKVRFVEAPLLEISASQIRSRIQQSRPFRDYLPPPVYQIIRQLNLYRPS